ncbi:MAG: hypothetical protein IRY90_00035 [Actinomadura rubrobrunea]|nr:hypothetical protein [Actinomadura rubrobrunea]
MPLQQGYFVGRHDGWELSYDSAHFYADMALTDVDADEAEATMAACCTGWRCTSRCCAHGSPPDGMQYVLPPDAPGAIPRPRVLDLRAADEDEVRAALEARRVSMGRAGRHCASSAPRMT